MGAHRYVSGRAPGELDEAVSCFRPGRGFCPCGFPLSEGCLDAPRSDIERWARTGRNADPSERGKPQGQNPRPIRTLRVHRVRPALKRASASCLYVSGRAPGELDAATPAARTSARAFCSSARKLESDRVYLWLIKPTTPQGPTCVEACVCELSVRFGTSARGA
jgi:hypothetical protein